MIASVFQGISICLLLAQEMILQKADTTWWGLSLVVGRIACISEPISTASVLLGSQHHIRSRLLLDLMTNSFDVLLLTFKPCYLHVSRVFSDAQAALFFFPFCCAMTSYTNIHFADVIASSTMIFSFPFLFLKGAQCDILW